MMSFFSILKRKGYVQLGLKPGDDEMVVDGGGHFSAAAMDGVHTLSLLLLSYTAHDRAEGNPHTWPCRGYSTHNRAEGNSNGLISWKKS